MRYISIYALPLMLMNQIQHKSTESQLDDIIGDGSSGTKGISPALKVNKLIYGLQI